MQLDAAGIAFLKNEEGCRLTAYQDKAGRWTIGYGVTIGVEPGDIITQDQADELLESNCRPVEYAVSTRVQVPLSQSEFNALVSFTYNVGIGGFPPPEGFLDSTLLRRLNEGDKREAAKEFGRWVFITVNGQKQVDSDLVGRRAREAALFCAGAGIPPPT